MDKSAQISTKSDSRRLSTDRNAMQSTESCYTKENEPEVYFRFPENVVQEGHKISTELIPESEPYKAPVSESNLTTACDTLGDMEELTSLYSILNELNNLESVNKRHELCLSKSLNENLQPKRKISQEFDSEQETPLLDVILTAGNSASNKRNDLKQQRGRSKSAVGDEISVFGYKDPTRVLQPLRRQSTYSEGKSKVSKWTKVKAAFKWERANVPALSDGFKHSHDSLAPVNNEVARYLRVPTMQGGGGVSSADSIMSSSSGHFLSEAGTPGTLSSTSSMDDIDSAGHNDMRRDSSKSDARCDSRLSDVGTHLLEGIRTDFHNLDDFRKTLKCSCNKLISPCKSSSSKSLRKHKVLPDFEALPEDAVVNLNITTNRRTKQPPSPLDLNLKHDLSELDSVYSSHQLKSPKDGGSNFAKRYRKISSPGNSSVPSSPSRLSDFFAELESEDFSSGDFSEPTSPNRLHSLQTCQLGEDEIHKRYELLRKKLDLEFESKRREWKKSRPNPSACRATAYTMVNSPKAEELQPCQANLSTALLEESLTPDFKKKLKKWRVKKQISLGNTQIQQHPQPISPHKDNNADAKAKIDWNLWKSGQLKIEGQGLSALPEQKDLPEEFQKKLEQWHKIKKSNSAGTTSDSWKRSSKHGEFVRKGSDDGRSSEKEKRVEKYRSVEKDNLEKLSKLKAIVAVHPVKEIQVQTAAGVMKFEGISRKFTRKLYEWEKARGIGPESSTFALLHPGYCPLDVGRISKECHNTQNSPTLSRSLSLDSIAPNNALAVISQQASSLSLNDVNDLKEMEDITANGELVETVFKKFEEPEAVMVEVEDHIVETASALIAAQFLVEQQTPIYKYEEVACNDYCNTRHIQSYESHTNLTPLLDALKRTDELLAMLVASSADMAQHEDLCSCQSVLCAVRGIYPYYKDNLMKPPVLNAVADVQIELGRLFELQQKSPLDEACCQEIMEERSREYSEELKGLQESLIHLQQNIQGGEIVFPIPEILPEINITTEDDLDCAVYDTLDATSRDQLSTTLEATDEMSASVVDEHDTSTTTQRNGVNVGMNGTQMGCKKKLRLRKMGSRQNSKTESDTSDDDTTHSIIDTPRRWKRKNYRLKQRSFDEDLRKVDDTISVISNAHSEDMVYVLKIKPGQPIEQSQSNSTNFPMDPGPNVLISPTESCVHLMPMEAHPAQAVLVGVNDGSNVFVKTRRKIFKTIADPNAACGFVVIEQDLDSGTPIYEENTENSEELLDDFTSNQYNEEQKQIEKLELQKPKLLMQNKAWSWHDLRVVELLDPRILRSSENLFKKEKNFKHPLATDSFRVNYKNCLRTSRDTCLEDKTVMQNRREHRYKKNCDKFFNTFTKSNGATVKKIESKINKNSIGAVMDTPILIPKVMTRHFPDYLKTTYNSEPYAVFSEMPTQLSAPLTERAQRLQRAKHDFLQETNSISKIKTDLQESQCSSANMIDQNLRIAENHLNTTQTLAESNPINGTISPISPNVSDAGTDQEYSASDTLTTSVRRSGKISSKLGFAILSSKLKRVRVKPEKPVINNERAISVLCRQSILTDVIAAPHALASEVKTVEESVKKSQSSQAFSSSTNTSTQDKRLNKSHSEQFVRH